MPTLRERFVDFALGDEKRKLQGAVRQVYSAYLDGPFVLPQEELLRQLRETDSSIIQDLVMQLTYDNLGSLTGYQTNTDAERKRATDESRRLWRYAPLAQWSVNVWTYFGLGESVQIVCDDPDAEETWKECWSAERNAELFADDHLHESSNNVLVDGNIFLAAYASTLDGVTTWSEIPPEEISEIITDPDNSARPLFYKREFVVGTESRTLYYPDWQAFFDDKADILFAKVEKQVLADKRADKIADTEDRKTTVCVLHIAHNRKVRGSLWGYPILAIAAPYLRTHKQFMDSRLTVAVAKAMYVRRKKIMGGSRAMASVKARLNSTLSTNNALEGNPPAAPGSTELDNSMIETSDLPMTTGASDAKNDWEMFSQNTLIGMGLFPTTAGMDTSRWATALTMDKTQAMQWAAYRTFWKTQFKKIARVTLGYAEKYNSRSFQVKTVQVSIDELNIVDFPGIVASISQMLAGLTPLLQNGALPVGAVKQITQAFMRVTLKALGVTDTDITSDQTFRIARAELPQEVSRVLDAAIKKLGEGKIEPDEFARLFVAEFVENQK